LGVEAHRDDIVRRANKASDKEDVAKKEMISF
jgi:hypothetical protein